MSKLTENDAWDLMGKLVVATTGWSDSDLVTEYVGLMTNRWSDLPAATAAINMVCETWVQLARPPWAVLHGAYRSAVHRTAMERPAISTPGHLVSVREGRAIAAKAYERECRSRDPETDIHILSGFRSNVPNPEYLDRLLGVAPD